jgi:hypothetical protein
MSEIKHVIATVSNPIGKGDFGSCQEGHYRVDGDVLTMVTATGQPLRGTFGERITHRLQPGESAVGVAKKLTLGHWRASQGDETAAAFNRPIRYRNGGVA